MAVVDPGERAAAAGLTAVARNAAAAAAPAFAGAALVVPALGLPFLVAGGLKIAYDLALLAGFRGIRPPEEHDQPAPALSSTARRALSAPGSTRASSPPAGGSHRAIARNESAR